LQVPQKVVAVRRNEAQANVRCFGQAPVARRALGRLGGIDQGVALGDFFAHLGAGEKRLGAAVFADGAPGHFLDEGDVQLTVDGKAHQSLIS
jgi:hypothetical protein